MTMVSAWVAGFCPACGGEELKLRKADGMIRCHAELCPDREAVSKILQDSEIHHIVRFNGDGTFSVQHPLRERVDQILLDCQIHAVIVEQVADGLGKPEGTWRLEGVPFVPSPNGGDPQEADWVWEQIS